MTGNFQGFQVNDRNSIVRTNGNIGPRTIRLHEDSRRAAAEFDPFDLLAGGDIYYYQITAAEIRNQNQLAIQSELQAVGRSGGDGQRLDHGFLGNINDRDRAVVRICGPNFFAIRRKIKPFGPWPTATCVSFQSG